MALAPAPHEVPPANTRCFPRTIKREYKTSIFNQKNQPPVAVRISGVPVRSYFECSILS
jgi:hypothetical protein